MVSTRGKQTDAGPVKQKQSTKSVQADLVAQLDAALNSHETPDLHAAAEKESGTMGSRLRKRRRTPSPSDEGCSPNAKRLYRQTPASPEAPRGRAAGPSQALQHSSQDFKHNASRVFPAGTPAVMHQADDAQRATGETINHGGQAADEYPSQGYDEIGMIDTASFLPEEAGVHLRIQSLPVLDNLATQILNILANSSYRTIIEMATKPDTDPGKAYETLKDLFNHTKKVYSQHEPFLSPNELGLVENAHIDTVRKANMATFVTSVFGSQDVGFYHLNEYFLDTFMADGQKMLKTQAQIFLDLKTQAYISALTSKDRSRQEILDDLFPADLEHRLLSRRPGAKQVAPSEQDFLQRARNRRKALLDEPDTEEASAALPEKYDWEDFVRNVSSWISRNFHTIAGGTARKTLRPQGGSNISATHEKQRQKAQEAHLGRQGTQLTPFNQPAANGDDIAGKAHRAAQFAMQDYGQGKSSSSNTPQKNRDKSSATAGSQDEASRPQQPQYEFRFENELHPNVPSPPVPYFQHIPYQHPHVQNQWHPGSSGLHPSYGDQSIIPYPTQSAPTQVLYERARMAAATKVSPSTRHPGLPSQRRPWTTDEENSLMAGLDRVKGPHWSQILAMFGPGGTINEVLKDRNQVQLKDKARNLKLFFLKSNIEVPYYLQFVTGELKTRAPAQAAKHEAKGKEMSAEDRAHIEGVMALAGGSMQEGDQPLGETTAANATQQAQMPLPVNLNGNDDNVDPNL